MRRSSRRLRGEGAADGPDTAAKRQKSDESGEPPAVETTTTDQHLAWDAFLQSKCFLKVPGDFYDVFELAAELQPDSPCEAFVDTLEIRLCGPFDLVAAADKKGVTLDKPLHLHGRFFFDPPEVASVMVDTGSDVGRHWGYFRDSPDQVPGYVVCAEDTRECKFDIVGGSLFQVLESALEKRRSSLGADKAADLLKKIEAHRGEKARSRAQSASALRAKRTKESVAASLHHLFIVVPVDTKTNTGYRELPTTGKDLADLLDQLKQEADKKSPARKRLSELITRATIASDECDFGTGLLLGLDVFTAGSSLEKEALQLLRVGYMLLRRTNLYKIASGHCKHRSRDHPNASIQSIVASSSEASDKQMKATTVELPPSLLSRK
ncbi:hypothetical protein PF005_g9787 [Phytophthora fragariae]|uniref:Uncharacterized protein n=1 Tax=Phytophthora fragariae TaxID=53985 RepID=A0A6A3SH40_9STRA|nr:hypothetical protein PF003_g20203 [Phytophthora fragariae]KAE8937756.1 hypothetical protein PF009_g12343 [Phytophthora fragariae]KAE9011730.1 hypothetical protein PF011_g9235 [Phytophthora fragariae]KAE9104452.1 hypothetical protein PF010_g13377 [Phytophthora fragariae]KAE9113422.1 hypothetical protein PF007_g10743 [Phytophthora fragariae]